MDERDEREWFELLRFPTVGVDPARLGDCRACAAWLLAWLGRLGFAGETLEVPGEPPVAFARRAAGRAGAPTVLVYGHYDVQPPDPLDEWTAPPFEPVVRADGRIQCRGAQDDKGQFFSFLCGLRALVERGARLPNLVVLLEGQEESGSSALSRLAPELGERLRADALLVSDTSAAEGLRPAIVAGLRGVSYFTATLTAARCDLHSGRYGGIAPNPAQGMCELIASVHRPDGSVAVEGFSDGVESPTADELAAAAASTASDAEYEAAIGCAPAGGEAGLSCVERNSFRPTIEVNGVHSGYGGPGSKTVIPAAAVAKFSMRLVPGQDPRACMEALERHLFARVPRGMKLEISERAGYARGFRLPLSSPLFAKAREALGELDPRGAAHLWDGASIPVVALLKDVSGAAPLLVGWGQQEDRIHSPNESFSREQFARSRAWAETILPLLADGIR